MFHQKYEKKGNNLIHLRHIAYTCDTFNNLSLRN